MAGFFARSSREPPSGPDADRSPMTVRPVDELAATLGIRDEELLRRALSHPSTASGQLYERMEFLGDRVLGLVVADLLVSRFPDESEGDLARRLAVLVNRDSLVAVAQTLDLGQYLLLGKGEEDSGGREKPATLADSCEVVIGALYLDRGFEAAREFVAAHWTPLIAAAATPPQDAKTALQEWVQAAHKPLPVYRMLATEGPPHDPVFRIEAEVSGYPPASARGHSKRAAEQAAAAALLRRLTDAG
jgi:ribonuclease-3